MEIKILRGPSGRILTKTLNKNGTTNILKNMYPWCKNNVPLLVFCYENNVKQPKCEYCGEGLSSPHNKFCNSSCQMKSLGGFPKDCNIGRTPWNKGRKDNSYHCAIMNPEKWEKTKLRIGIANSGKNNGMYGWDSEEQRLKQSETVKRKILSGEFTPNSNNRNTSFNVLYKNKNYRSSWEAAFASINPSFEYEKIRIPYLDETGKSRIYISDFYDDKTRSIFEIRPKSLYDENSNKISAAKEYCEENGYKYIHIDIEYLVENESLIDFDGLNEPARKLNNAIKKYKRDKKA